MSLFELVLGFFGAPIRTARKTTMAANGAMLPQSVTHVGVDVEMFSDDDIVLLDMWKRFFWGLFCLFLERFV